MRNLICTALLLAIGLAAELGIPGSAVAQADSHEATHELREALFQELSRDVDALDLPLGLLKRVVKLVTPTVVHIESLQEVGEQRVADEAGSGIIIELDERLYVLTNRHVVDSAALADIRIRTSQGRVLHPSRMWADPNTDVAVLRVDETDLIAARLGNSDKMEIGDFVLAVGSPFGLSHSVSYGIISAKGRWDLALGESNVNLQDFLQTDAAINPGNSGGPLLNLRGEVIGINTAIASNSGGNEGIGFSIPINLATHVAQQLVKFGEVSTAYLGVVLDRAFDPYSVAQVGLKVPGGALVKNITPGSPAEQSGFRQGDIILEFNGVRVEDDAHLVNLVSLAKLDQLVSVRMLRDDRLQTLQVRVGNRRDFEP